MGRTGFGARSGSVSSGVRAPGVDGLQGPGRRADSGRDTALDESRGQVGVVSLGGLVRSRRRARGLTLADVAGRVGCTKGYLSLIETGRKGPPSAELIAALERALEMDAGALARVAAVERTPSDVRDDYERLRSRDEQAKAAARRLRALASGGSVDALYRSGALRSLIDAIDPEGSEPGQAESIAPVSLPLEVPLINRVSAGYPAGFTDLGFPARVADEYVRCPDVSDPDAFAARIVGDSMEPAYREGDVVVFSPARDLEDGCDCFARLEPDSESTFKRVYFERDDGGAELIRLQPVNNRYAPRVLPREMVAGLYRAVRVIRAV